MPRFLLVCRSSSVDGTGSLSGVMIILVMGVSGSGKSTIGRRLADELGYEFIEGDNFHPPKNIKKMQAGVPLDDDDRWPWLSAVRLQMERAEFEESNLVATCSALKRAYRRILIPRNSPIQLVHLTGDRRLISDRLESRKRHFMPPELLASQFASLEPPRANERCINVDVRQTPQASVTAIRQALKVGSS